MDFVKNNTPETIAQSLAPSFDGTSIETLSSAIQSYKNIDAYMDTLVMKAEDFDRLQDVIIEAGVMNKKASFSAVVDNTIALKVE